MSARTEPAVQIEGLGRSYGTTRALDALSLTVWPGEIFGLLGPNGSGKTTLFRILSTLMPAHTGRAWIHNLEVATQPDAVRRHIGVVFQEPSLDKKLTVRENLQHQGALYGLGGPGLSDRILRLLGQFGLLDRGDERVEALSGGLRRRLDLAKSLLHEPQLLLLDEPTAALDPAARRIFWQHLHDLRGAYGVTHFLTTHLMEEAERCDRLAILDRGRLVALDTPSALKSRVGGDIVTLRSGTPGPLAVEITARFDVPATVVHEEIRIEHESAQELMPRLLAAFGERIQSVTLARPSLEDVFVKLTGHRFEEEDS